MRPLPHFSFIISLSSHCSTTFTTLFLHHQSVFTLQCDLYHTFPSSSVCLHITVRPLPHFSFIISLSSHCSATLTTLFLHHQSVFTLQCDLYHTFPSSLVCLHIAVQPLPHFSFIVSLYDLYHTFPSSSVCLHIAVRPLPHFSFIISLSSHCSFWLQYYPDHTKGLILMGDLNVNQLKNLDAAEQVRHVCVGVEGGSYMIAIALTCLCGCGGWFLHDSHCSDMSVWVWRVVLT